MPRPAVTELTPAVPAAIAAGGGAGLSFAEGRASAVAAGPGAALGLGLAVSAGEVADEQLVERLRDGDAAAGETLCRRYAQPLLRYLQRVGGDGMAEELHQQAWLSVLDNLEK